MHNEDEQYVVMEEGQGEADLKERKTELMQFFKLNEVLNASGAPLHKYVDMPRHYTWNNKEWIKRAEGRKCSTIGRVDNVLPTAGEKFYLRMLLHDDWCKGKESFKELKEGADTFKEKCRQLGLLKDDQEWSMVLTDAVQLKSCRASRSLFVTLLIWCEVANPLKLFDEFWLHWTDDLVKRAGERRVSLTNEEVKETDSEEAAEEKRLSHEKLKTLVLLDLKRLLFQYEKELGHFQLPEPTAEEEEAVVAITGGRSVLVQDELDFNVEEMASTAAKAERSLTDEQAAIYGEVQAAVLSGRPKCIFIQASGGCGKTFLLNQLLAWARSLEPGGSVALATATTGKAATLLLKGRTFHSRFKPPLILSEDSRLMIPVQTELAKLIRMAKLILVHEATMLDNRLLEALHLALQDILDNKLPFGGKVVILSGDFRQTLPVVKGGSRAGIVERCINQHYLFEQHFKVMTMTVNMRVNASGDPRLVAWDQWLQAVGDGLAGEAVQVPEGCTHIVIEDKKEAEALGKLVDAVFLEMEENFRDLRWLNGRSILTPTNTNVDKINDAMVEKMPGKEVALCSADHVDNEQDGRSFSVEYCNSLNPTGLPRHCVVLKPGVPVMLLRNLDPSRGLCNGTKMIYRRMSAHGRVMICLLMKEKPEEVAIPRIQLRPQEKEYAFEWSRRQFPVRVAFAMTINKSQGTTLGTIGVWLPQPVFGHGQLYVAVSRVGRPEGVHFAVKPVPGEPEKTMRNVVYKEVLEKEERREDEPMDTETAGGRIHEVAEDITDDYEAIEAEYEKEFTEEEAMEEKGPEGVKEVARRVAARVRPTRQWSARPKEVEPTPEEDGAPSWFGDTGPLSEYELAREERIAELAAEFQRVFGRPLKRDAGLLKQGILEQEEDELEETEMREDEEEDDAVEVTLGGRTPEEEEEEEEERKR